MIQSISSSLAREQTQAAESQVDIQQRDTARFDSTLSSMQRNDCDEEYTCFESVYDGIEGLWNQVTEFVTVVFNYIAGIFTRSNDDSTIRLQPRTQEMLRREISQSIFLPEFDREFLALAQSHSSQAAHFFTIKYQKPDLQPQWICHTYICNSRDEALDKIREMIQLRETFVQETTWGEDDKITVDFVTVSKVSSSDSNLNLNDIKFSVNLRRGSEQIPYATSRGTLSTTELVEYLALGNLPASSISQFVTNVENLP